MREGFLTVDINSIESTTKLMDDRFNELVNMISKYKEMIEDTKNIYDTESATIYRKIALGYIELIERYLNNDFKPYIDKLDEIRGIYIDEYNSISKSVGGA